MKKFIQSFFAQSFFAQSFFAQSFFAQSFFAQRFFVSSVVAGTMLLLGLPGLGMTNAWTAEKPVLTVYTYDSFASDWGPGPGIAQSFEAGCDCTVEYVATADSIAMLSKVLLEGKNTRADVLVGIDTNLVKRAHDSGLFTEHRAPKLKEPWLPSDYSDDLFLPFDWGLMAFIYNSETMKNPPESFEELIALPDDVKIVVQDPRTSTPGYNLLLWLETAFPHRAAEIWQGLRPKILTFTKGWSEAYGMYLEGEADMVLSYTTSPAYHLIAEGVSKHKAANFQEGHIAQIEVAGALASSENLTLAREFLQHLQSVEVQSQIPTTNWMFPIRRDVELPTAFASLIAPQKTFIADPTNVEDLRKERLARWQSAVR